MMKLPIIPLCAALAPGAGLCEAAVIYSGELNIPVSSGFDSTYLDVDAFTSVPAADAGWDVDVFFGGEAFGNSAAFQPARAGVGVDTAILRLDAGTVVDASLNYFNAEAGSSTHVGSSPEQFVSGSEGYLGFRFTENGGAGPYYGWMRVVFSNTGGAGTIIDWAYDDSGAPMTVGAVPEPSGVLLAGVGAAGLLFRRRGTRASANG